MAYCRSLGVNVCWPVLMPFTQGSDGEPSVYETLRGENLLESWVDTPCEAHTNHIHCIGTNTSLASYAAGAKQCVPGHFRIYPRRVDAVLCCNADRSLCGLNVQVSATSFDTKPGSGRLTDDLSHQPATKLWCSFD